MRINNLAIVVNTHSSMKDIWEMFTGELNFYFPKQKVYFFSDQNSKLFLNHKKIIYNSNDDFTSQYYNCLSKVTEPYVITLNEDYILYDFVKNNFIKKYISILKYNNNLSFIRFHKGPNYTNIKYQDYLYFLDSSKRHLYSQTATLWKRNHLLELYKAAPRSYIGKKNRKNKNILCTEDEIDKICRIKKLKGLYSFHNEKKIGHSNYDSYTFPYLQSVIVKGQWNYKEYKQKLKILMKKYKINESKRKIFLNNYKDSIIGFLKKVGFKNEY